jgi:signal transduction histidine kinase
MHPNIFFFSSLSVCITTLLLIILIAKYKKTKAQDIWLYFNISLLVWGIGATLASINRNSIEFSNFSWRLGCLGVAFLSSTFLHFVLSLTSKNNYKILIFAYIQSSITCLLLITTNLINTQPRILFQNNFFLNTMGPLFFVWFFFWFSIITYAFLILYQHKKINNKFNINFISMPTLLAFLSGSLNFLNPYGAPIFQYGNFGISIYCIAVTYFIFKNQIPGIEIVLRKSLFYSVLIAGLTALYLLLIFLMEWLFRGIVGYKSIVLSLSSAFLMALVFNPLRNKIQNILDKFFLGNTPQEIANENTLLKQELERSERLKVASTLALGLAHEVKNPLTTLKTFTEFLPQHINDREFLEKFSKIVPGEIERVNDIIKQLLQFSKPAPPSFQLVNLYQLIQEILFFLNSELLKHKIHLIESYGDRSIQINADPSQIKQALLNILFNSIEAMPNGGTLTIKTQSQHDGFVEISIADEGCGISKEDLKHIFDPFYSKKEAGTGLGLSITHQIIRNHNGSIIAESEPGNGTTFRIILPPMVEV